MDVDWHGCAEKLDTASLAAIRRLADDCPDEPICFFSFAANPRYGDVLIAFDTLANNIRAAMLLEEFARSQRETVLTRADAWRSARYFLKSPVLTAFNTNSADFAFPRYAEVKFPEWRELAEEGQHPARAAHEDDYLESNVRLVMWRAAERLVSEGTFRSLRLGAPFMLGYSIHDQEEVVLRLLNWPAGAE